MTRQIVWLTLLAGCQWVFPLTAAPDAGTPVESCTTKANALVDLFDENVGLRPNWEVTKNPNDQALAARVTSAGLELSADVAGAVSVSSDFAYDLLDSRFAIQLSNSLPIGGSNFVRWGVLDIPAPEAASQTSSVEWTFKDNLLVPTLFDGSSRDIATGIPYDKDAHRYLGFSRVGDKTYWEVSTDGTSFKPLYEATVPWTRFVRPYMEVDHQNSGDPPLLTFFNELNQLPAGTVCPAEGLQTSFSEENPLEWRRLRTTGCNIDVRDDAVVFTFAPQSSGFQCDYGSAGMYNLIDHSVDLAVGPLKLLSNGDTAYLDIESFDHTIVTIDLQLTDGQLSLRGLVAKPGQGVDERFSIADPGDRFWRITGGTDLQGKQSITWSTSADGVTYVDHASFSGLAGFEAARVILGAIANGGDPQTSISYDSVGHAP